MCLYDSAYEELKSLKEKIRSYANEIANQLTKDEVSQIQEIFVKLDELDDEIRYASDAIDEAWDRVATF